jgi:small subunit ribosomal protein S1
MSEEVKTNAPVSADDLKTGMALKGVVKRLELYGAFVDIGVGQDGLLHISQLGKTRVRNVEDVLKVGDEITVYILKVDKQAGRVALSLVEPPAMTWDQLREGQTVTGRVVRIEKFGVFVEIGAERPGMVHVSELAEGFVENPSDVVSVGQDVEARILKVNRKKRQIDLTMKEQNQHSYQADMVDDEEEAEEVPTAMALAFRRAMEAQEDADEVARKNKKRGDSSSEQDDIIARTLRNHSSTN